MATLKSILKQYNLTTQEAFINKALASGKDKSIVALLHAESIEDAANKLFWEISAIQSVESDLKEQNSMRINWDNMQRNSYNILWGDLNDRRKKLITILSKIMEIL